MAFHLSSCALLACALLLSPAVRGSESAADRVFLNGAVYTVNASQPWAEAVAITNGRIRFVGSSEDAAGFIGDDTIVTDLRGRMLMPGFHDSHMHPMAAGTRFLRCQLQGLEWPDGVLAALRECAARLPAAQWLRGVGLADEAFESGELHKSQLDEIAPERGAVVTANMTGGAWVSSATLAAAGIDANTPDPKGGSIERDPGTGEPTGVLWDEAWGLVWPLIPPPDETSAREALKLASQKANAYGITFANEAASYDWVLPAYRAADAAGEMTLRVQASIRWDLEEDGAHLDEMLAGRAPGPGRRFRADAVKLFVDGKIGPRAAAVLEPYRGTRDFGDTRVTAPRLNAIVRQLDAAGFQVHMHVVGDRAVRMGLDAIERAIELNGPKDRRHQLAHVKLIHPDDIPRFAELGVVADFQILWAKRDEDLGKEIHALGPARSRWLMPINSVFETGARVVLGSDWISESMNPLFSIQIALTRRPVDGSEDAFWPEERITLEQAIRAYTINGAWLARLETETGTIEVGKAADLIVLEENLFEVEPMDLSKVRVVLTLVEGEEVFRHPRFQRP